MRDVGAAIPPLERTIGVRALALTAFSYTVGSGIFGLPAPVAAILGPQAIVAYLVCAALFALLGLCLAEAGSRIGRAGGLYAYADEAFGPFVGWIAATLLWVANCVLSSAAVANLLADTLGALFPLLRTAPARSAFILVLYATLASVNLRGVRGAVGLSELSAAVKAVPLVALVVGGVFFVDPENLRWTVAPAPGRIAEASTMLFFAFMGIEGALCTSGEVRDPQRTVPRAILLSLSMVSGLYMGVQLVVQGLLGPALPAAEAPLLAAGGAAFGPPGVWLLTAGTLVAAAGYFASDMLAGPRTLYALAHDGQLPSRLARVHPRYRTPAHAIVAYAMVSAVLALSGTFRQLAIVSSAGTLVLYAICCLGVLRLRARNPAPEGSFRAPGGPAAPLLAVAVILWFLASLRGIELLATVGLVAVAAATFVLRGRLKLLAPLLVLAGATETAAQPAREYTAYVASEAADTIARVRFGAEGLVIEKSFPTGVMPTDVDGPHGLALAPDGRSYFVSLAHGQPEGALWKYSTANDAVLGRVTLGMFPATLQVTPNGEFAYVVNFNLHGDRVPSSVSVVATDPMLEVARIRTCLMPHGSRFNPAGTRHYSACMMDDTLVEIDTSTMRVARHFVLTRGHEAGRSGAPVPGSGGDASAHSGGHGAEAPPAGSAACSPTWAQPSSDGARVFVACNGASELVEVDVDKWTVSRRLPAGPGIYNLATTKDGKLVATNRRGQSVSVFDVASGRELARVPTKRRAVHGVAITRDDRYAFVTSEGVGGEPGAVEVLDLIALKMTASVDVAPQAGGIDVIP